MIHKEYRPTIAQLRTFTTIAEFGHFGSAAAQLGISQPSLSQALSALETGLGVQLIERSTRKVIITPIGRTLLPHAQATLDSLEALVGYARGAMGGLVGVLSIGMIPTIAPYILPEFLQLLAAEAPKLEPRIIEEKSLHLVNGLRKGTLDMAVLGMPLDNGGVQTIELFTEEFALVVPAEHPLAGARDVQLEDIKDLHLLLLDDGHCLRDQVLELCRSVEMTNDPRSTATRAASLGTVMRLVAAGYGATLVPMSAVRPECVRPGIGLATFAGGAHTAGRTIGLAFRSSTIPTDGYEKLGEILRQAYEQAVNDGRTVLKDPSSPKRHR